MKNILFLIVVASIISCDKKEIAAPEKRRTEFAVIDSKLPLFLEKIDFDENANSIQMNDGINAKISETVANFYNTESGVDGDYKKNFKISDCYFKTIRLSSKLETVFVILLKRFPSNELTSKILFYHNASKEFVGNPVDFKIYALYDFVDGKIMPTNLKSQFKIEGPEIRITDTVAGNEFEFTRLWHNGTFNSIQSTVFKITENHLDTIKMIEKPL